MLGDEFSQEQIEPESGEDSRQIAGGRGKPGIRFLRILFEDWINPFELLSEAIAEPGGILVLLMAVAVIAVAGLVVTAVIFGAYEFVQEVILGGGPPQGLGLK